MPVTRAWIACEWRAQLILFLCRFHPESGQWNRTTLPSRLDGGLCEGLRRIPQYPQTSSPDRSALATLGSRCIPANDATHLIAEWVESNQGPTILSVFPPYSVL